jgi:hypothetical protein
MIMDDDDTKPLLIHRIISLLENVHRTSADNASSSAKGAFKRSIRIESAAGFAENIRYGITNVNFVSVSQNQLTTSVPLLCVF